MGVVGHIRSVLRLDPAAVEHGAAQNRTSDSVTVITVRVAATACRSITTVKGHAYEGAVATTCPQIRVRRVPLAQTTATSGPNIGLAFPPSGWRGCSAALPSCRRRSGSHAFVSTACATCRGRSPAFTAPTSASVCTPVISATSTRGRNSLTGRRTVKGATCPLAVPLLFFVLSGTPARTGACTVAISTEEAGTGVVAVRNVGTSRPCVVSTSCGSRCATTVAVAHFISTPRTGPDRVTATRRGRRPYARLRISSATSCAFICPTASCLC